MKWNICTQEVKDNKVMPSKGNPKESGKYLCTCAISFRGIVKKYLQMMEYNHEKDYWHNVGDRNHSSHVPIAWTDLRPCELDGFTVNHATFARLKDEDIIIYTKDKELSDKAIKELVDKSDDDVYYPVVATRSYIDDTGNFIKAICHVPSELGAAASEDARVFVAWYIVNFRVSDKEEANLFYINEKACMSMIGKVYFNSVSEAVEALSIPYTAFELIV